MTLGGGGTYTFTIDTPSAEPNLNITRVGDQVQIGWSAGTLLESSFVEGPYTNSATQISPFIFTPTDMKFFRGSVP